MNVTYLLLGIVLGVLLFGGALVMSGQQSVDADSVCESRFGDEWSGEQVDTDWQNQSATLKCTNGNRTERIGVDISAEVNL